MRPHARPAHDTPRERNAALLAVAITLLWHCALFGWLSTLTLRTRGTEDTATSATHTIDIVFVPPRETLRAPGADTTQRRTRRAPAAPRIAQAPPASSPTDPSAGRAAPQDADTARIEIVAGDDRWMPVPAAHERAFAPRNPLARVDGHALDVAPRLRVRMRSPRSVEAWLKVLAPAGYEADPCPELARAIAGLAADAAAPGRALLEDAIRFEASHCR